MSKKRECCRFGRTASVCRRESHQGSALVLFSAFTDTEAHHSQRMRVLQVWHVTHPYTAPRIPMQRHASLRSSGAHWRCLTSCVVAALVGHDGVENRLRRSLREASQHRLARVEWCVAGLAGSSVFAAGVFSLRRMGAKPVLGAGFLMLPTILHCEDTAAQAAWGGAGEYRICPATGAAHCGILCHRGINISTTVHVAAADAYSLPLIAGARGEGASDPAAAHTAATVRRVHVLGGRLAPAAAAPPATPQAARDCPSRDPNGRRVACRNF